MRRQEFAPGPRQHRVGDGQPGLWAEAGLGTFAAQALEAPRGSLDPLVSTVGNAYQHWTHEIVGNESVHG